MARTLFWVFSAILAYVYLGYPFIVRACASLAGRQVRRRHLQPTITVVISAYNEEKSIWTKIDNVLTLEYPRDLVDVIVVSDGSSDSTDEIVKAVGSARVRLLRLEGRQGKTACQNLAVTEAAGEVIVFTDATTIIEKQALSEIAANFADPEVGCVGGALVYRGSSKNLTAAGGTSYWGYELVLRNAESRLGTLIGVSGCLYAVRKAAYRPIPPGSISDFVIAMRIRDQGLRTVLEPRAVCFEKALEDPGQELSMRIRVASRSIAALAGERSLLNPFADPLFAWQLWSHKLLRYASPYCWAIVLIACATLVADLFYCIVLISQLAFIIVGAAGFLLLPHTRKRLGLPGSPYYFLLTNVASFVATVLYLMGKRTVTWNPVR